VQDQIGLIQNGLETLMREKDGAEMERARRALEAEKLGEPLTVPMFINGSSGNPELEMHMAKIFAEVFEVWKTKQHDYGPSNIAQMGEVGVATRANDKVQRLMHLDGSEAANEPIIDSWLDLCDYGAIGAAVHRGLWPKPAPRPFEVKSRNGLTEFYVDGELRASVSTEAVVKLILKAAGNVAILNFLGDAS
jgi:hypothetical protein